MLRLLPRFHRSRFPDVALPDWVPAVLGLAVFVAGGTGVSEAADPPPAAATQNVQTDEVLKTYNDAMAAFQAGDYAKASEGLEFVVSKAGEGAQLEAIYFTLGASYFNLGNYDKATEVLKTYLEKYPKDSRAADAKFFLGLANCAAAAAKSFD